MTDHLLSASQPAATSARRPRRATRPAGAPAAAERQAQGRSARSDSDREQQTLPRARREQAAGAAATAGESRRPRRRKRRPAGGETSAAARTTTSPAAAAPVTRPAVAAPVAATAAPTAAPADGRNFGDLGVPAALVTTLAKTGITSPFPIQSATLPDSLAGRDVLGCGKTGSGKTVAFALPLVARLSPAVKRVPGRPRGLVLVPTRELATQVAATLTPLAAAAGLRTQTIFGGVSQRPQVTALTAGVDIVVACPGRLQDLVNQGHVSLDRVQVTVLDEADHMADLGFLPTVRRLLDGTPRDGQRLLFSATLDNGIDVLARRYLHEPVTHRVDPPVAPVSTMAHHVLHVQQGDKAVVVRELAAGPGRTVLFVRTKHAARKWARDLTQHGLGAVDLHGNLSQNARQRNLAAFTSGEAPVLVATDIAARGIHVDDVSLVVHVDPPAEHKAYLHRSGRTARAGASGVVVTLATPDQRGEVNALAKAAGVKPTFADARPGTVQSALAAAISA